MTVPSKMLKACCGCCAAEICCNAAAARARAIEEIAKFTGAEPEYCEKMLDWMDHEGLIFAPESLRPFVQDIVAAVKKHHKVE